MAIGDDSEYYLDTTYSGYEIPLSGNMNYKISVSTYSGPATGLRLTLYEPDGTTPYASVMAFGTKTFSSQ